MSGKDKDVNSKTLPEASVSKVFDTATIALALQSAEAQSLMAANYLNALSRLVFSQEIEVEGGQTEVNTHQYKLKTEYAHQFLKFMWKESPHLSQVALDKGGLKRDFAGRDISKNKLADLIASKLGIVDKDQERALRTDIGRIAKAADAYGLIIHQEVFIAGTTIVRKNKKPMKGTELLHRLMVEVHARNAIYINELLLQTSSDARNDGGKQ